MIWLAEKALESPRRTALLLVLATAVIGAGLLRLETDLGYRAFLGREHPSVVRFDAFLDRFGGGLPMRAVFSCREAPACDDVFDPPALEMMRSVGEALAASPAVVSVTSPANATVLAPTPRGPQPRRFFEGSELVSDRARLAKIAQADALWRGDLVSSDGVTGSIVIDLASSGSDDARRAYDDLSAALAPYEDTGWVFHRVGGPVEFVVAGGELDAAMQQIVPVMVLLIALSLVLLFRSIAVAVLVLATTGVAVLWSHAALGWLGWPRNSLTQTLAPLILVIGVCDGIHLVSRYASHAASEESRDALRSAIREVARPCWITSLTTSLGFLSFLTADLESFRQYGAIAAVGVMAALLLTFTLLPLLLHAVPVSWIEVPAASRSWQGAIGWLVAFSNRRRVAVLAVSTLVLVAGIFGTSRLSVHSSFDELYGSQSRVVKWSHFVAENLRKPDTLEVEVTLPDDTSIDDPLVARTIREVQDAVGAIEELEAARSFLDHPLGAAAVSAAISDSDQELDDSLARWIAPDRRSLRISFATDKEPQEVMDRMMREARERLDATLPEGFDATLTGPFALVYDMVGAIRSTQLRSFAGAAIAVVIVLTLSLRSLRWAAIAMVPTLLPVFATLGGMALIDVPLDVGTAMVAAVVIGIAVDDVVHLLDAFRAQQARGVANAIAIQRAVRHVGQALVSTSFALTVGFAALALSPWASVSHFGIISAIAILSALLADLVVLPALIGVTTAEPAAHGRRTGEGA